MPAIELCPQATCRRRTGHTGNHNRFPSEAWGFLDERDKQKLTKAGFATPRGGAKGAYQNHVGRSNRVIVPYERLADANFDLYENGWVVRLLPDQYFEAPGVPRAEFVGANAQVIVGENAFVLYRSHASYSTFPPPENWEVRSLERDGVPVTKRGEGVDDLGQYVVRLANEGPDRPATTEGPPQGIFAPEYSNEETNFLAKCVLAWLTITSYQSPYTTTQAAHLRAILAAEGLADFPTYESRGALRHGLTACPLCLRIIHYGQLHSTINFQDEVGLENAATQVEGATRSTDVNLFHLIPLVYGSLQHTPSFVAWGHAHCNTRLGQRRCFSLHELQAMDLKVGILREEDVETIGWISEDYKMIRSPEGAVWVQLSADMTPEEIAGFVPGHGGIELEEGVLPEEPTE
jgi:hypothetical protein